MSRFLLISLFLIAAVVLQVTADSICDAVECSENRQCYECKQCTKTCKNPNPMCPRICDPGPDCACITGYVLHNNKCIPKSNCPGA
ncbi:cysteine-rich venom protein 6-like [Microplitis mediator]|uniref:cysteine-rich venom protein 6-like n=1 Tax=Microplitis mediator TaxID=375433 RepID=UPI0025557D98|nr:cysteine-rich venom protein 6-like [Microplitis mediator]